MKYLFESFSDFLNEKQLSMFPDMKASRTEDSVNEALSWNDVWQAKKNIIFDRTPEDQHSSDNAIYYDKDPSKKELISEIEEEFKAFLKRGPWLRSVNKDRSSKIQWHYGGLSPDTIGTIREIFPRNGGQSYLYCECFGVIKSKLGQMEVEFDIRYGGDDNRLPYFGHSIDHMDNSFDEYVKSPKVQKFLKDAYLSIPDSRETDDEIVMSKKAGGDAADTNWYRGIPKAFRRKIYEDPVFDMYTEITDDSDGWTAAEQIWEIFKDLNQKYYKEWLKIHRKGLGGALRGVKAWFLTLNEHEEIIEQQTDPELMAKMEEEVIKKSEECPRCGLGPDECTCHERDQFSTVNAFRAPSGVKKEKKNFKA